LLCFVSSALAHMSMQYPYPRDNGGTYAMWKANEPMITVHPQVCHGLAADTTVREGNKFTVGDTITIDIYGSVPHGGGHCTFWYSTDDATFTKIIDIKDCTLYGAQVTLPETMAPECEDKCTFAFSWVPVNSGGCEIYSNCADIQVTGAKGGDANPITKNFQTEIIDQGPANGYGCVRVDPQSHWTTMFMPLKTEYDASTGSGDSGSGSVVTPSPTVPAVVPTSRITTSPATPSGSGILITNKAGSGAWWYMITLSDVPSSIEIESVYMRDSLTSSEWQQGNYQQTWLGNYYYFNENPPFKGPFDFKIVSTSGLTIESEDVVEDYSPGKSGRMTESFNDAFTMDDGTDTSDPVERTLIWITVFVLAWIGVCVVGVMCHRQRKRRQSLSQMEKMSTAVDESHQVAEIEISVVDVESEDETMKPIGVQ